MSHFREVQPKDFQISPFHAIGSDWMLITAEKEGRVNTMTASWGGLGVIWGRNAAYVFVRDSRYTKEFIDRESYYTLCFFPDAFHKALGYLGTKSGRDEDKVAKVGLTPVFGEGYTYFAEAELVLVCRTLYQAPLKEEFFRDAAVMDANYPERDFHDLYIGEIVKVLVPD
jgi:flavin reductase (DIM6/NTAB) family NADH-FMN oxidoreductase RutF